MYEDFDIWPKSDLKNKITNNTIILLYILRYIKYFRVFLLFWIENFNFYVHIVLFALKQEAQILLIWWFYNIVMLSDAQIFF